MIQTKELEWQTSHQAAVAAGMTLAFHARTAPDRVAVVAPASERSFGALNSRANQLVRALRARGLTARSGVALICSNRAEFMEVHACCMRAGFVFTPINWHLTGKEAAYIVGDCEAEAIIVESRFQSIAARLTAASAQAPVQLAIGSPMDGFEDYEGFIGAHNGEDIEDPQLGSPMLYTSGTTGSPKGVYRWPPRPTSMLSNIMRNVIRFDPDRDTSLVTGPLYHAAPLNLNAVAALSAGVGLVLMDKWDAEETLALIERHRVAYTHVVPTMFTRLLRLPDTIKRQFDVSCLRAVIHGAAPCPAHIKRDVISWLGPIVFEYYAATEGGATLVNSEDWLQRPGTVGKPVEDAEVRVLDESMNIAPPFVEGTAYFRAASDNRFVYFKSEEKTAGSYHDNFFTMGDRGYLDDAGYLFLSGRNAELILSGGVNIYPQEIDDALSQLPCVHEVCTVGVPNDEWGEEVKAVVELTEGTAPSDALVQEMMTHCLAHLAKFKCPRSIEFQNNLPRLPSGKIQRHKVRAPYWAE